MSNSPFDQFYNSIRNQSDVTIALQPGGSLNVKQALAIYQNGYIGRLTEVLADKFETIQKLIGPESFKELSAQYIHRYPSLDANLENYGNEFSSFLNTHDLKIEFPFIAELANIEILRSVLFHQKYEKGQNTELLAHQLNMQSKISFISSMSFCKNEYPISAIWTALSQDLDPPDMTTGELTILHKQDHSVFLLGLDSSAISVFSKLQSGQTLEVSLEGIADDLVIKLIQLFGENKWVRSLL
jgi:hypothetical protein